jgi:hypothetical protein
MNRIIVSAATCAVACAAPALRATVVTLNPNHDTTLFQGSDNNSNGAGPYIYVGQTNFAGARRALTSFDIASAVPSGATINSASLLLTVTRVHGFGATLTLHKVSASWGEAGSNSGDPGGGGTLAQAGDATWKYRSYTDTEWATSGGDFAATVSSSATLDNFATLAFPTSVQLVADVQSWLNAPANNFGWLILGDESASGANRFASRENADPTILPKLTIDFTVAAPPASTYNTDADSNWDTPAAWNGDVPNAANAVVNFGSVITAPRTITLNTARTAGVLNFDNANRYTISGTGSLTVTGTAAAVNVVSGGHTMAVPVTLSDNTSLNVTPSASVLTLGQLSIASGKTLTKSGAGAVEVKNLRGDDVRINAGRIKVLADGSDAGASNIASLTVATGASLDLTDNDAVLGAAGSITAENVRQLLVDGRLLSTAATSTRGLGYGANSILGKTTFSGQTVNSGHTLVKYTYLGDADLNGQVDVADLGSLATNWQSTNVWTGGDFDYNGSVDVNDLGLLATNWQAGVGNPLGPSLAEALSSLGLGGVSVPEPCTLGLLMTAALKSHRRRRSAPRRTS